MIRLLIFLVILAAILGVVVGVVYLVFLLFSNMQPNTNKIRKDLARMKSLLPPKEDLVPMVVQEMELLSLDQVNNNLKKRVTTEAHGTIVSIYQEPMVNYVYKKYLGAGEDAILYLQTSNREFAYRIKNKGTEVFMNQKSIGTLRKDGILYGNRKRMIARINEEEEDMPILVFDNDGKNLREVGALKKYEGKKINPRALELVDAKMTIREEDMLLALALFKIAHDKVQPSK